MHKIVIYICACGVLCITMIATLTAAYQRDRARAKVDVQQADKVRYCAAAADALDSLRAALADPVLDARTRVAGAGRFVVIAARYCTGDDNIADLGWSSIYGDKVELDRELARLEASFH